MHIQTNHGPRPIIFGFELNARERAEFDWLDEDELTDAQFVRYHGSTYHLGEFMRPSDNSPLALLGWDGSHPDSFYSGVLIRFTSDFEQVICGTYVC